MNGNARSVNLIGTLLKQNCSYTIFLQRSC